MPAPGVSTSTARNTSAGVSISLLKIRRLCLYQPIGFVALKEMSVIFTIVPKPLSLIGNHFLQGYVPFKPGFQASPSFTFFDQRLVLYILSILLFPETVIVFLEKR